jgi:hypothetical protein
MSMVEPILMEALKVMRKAVVLAAVCILAGLAAQHSYAACPAPLAMNNGTGYPIIGCKDSLPVSAFAYQPGNPIATNTGLVDIACEADLGFPPCNVMPGTNFIGDNIIGIATDWSTVGVNGCPLGNPNRIYLSLQCNDGTGVIASISGQCSVLGYSTEAFYDYNGGAPSLDVGLASAKKNGRPTVTTFTRSGGMDMFNVHVDPPTLQSDCSPGSLAEVYLSLGYCADTEINCAGLVQPSRGNLYSFTGPCSTNDRNPINRDKNVWVTKALDAAGNAAVSLPTPPAGQCNYLGTTMVVGGNESPFIAAFVLTGDPTAASPRAESVRASKKGNSVEVTFSTSSELGLAGFNVYAGGKAKGGELKLNSSQIGATGVGGAGSSYSVSFTLAEFKGNRSVVVESVLTDNTTLRAEPVDF